MNRPKQCATEQTQGDSQLHNTPASHTSTGTLGQQPSLKALAEAVLSRAMPRTNDAHCAPSSRTSPANQRQQGNGPDRVLDDELECLIQAATNFWQYDADDLRLIRAAAATDPDGIRLALSTDPLKPFYGLDLDTLFNEAGKPGQATHDSERKHHAND